MPRLALSQLASVVLLWQLSLTVANPVVQFLYGQSQEAVDDCECGHGLGAMCPMHKSPRGRTACTIRSAANPAQMTLVSLVAPVGPSTSSMVVAEVPAASWLHQYDRFPLDRILPPEAPPPRF